MRPYWYNSFMKGLPEKRNEIDVSLRKRWRDWPYKNTALLIISLFAFFYLAETSIVKTAIEKIGSLSYFGAFLTGIFFVSSFTVAPAAVILFNLAENLHPWGVALLAGAGAMVGDYIIFAFLKDRVFDEIKPLFAKVGGPLTKKLFATPYFSWLLPILGAVIIASPIPDEIGISILGLSKVKKWQFLLIAFVLNALGIMAVIGLSRVI